MVDPPPIHTAEEAARLSERVRELVSLVEQDLAILRCNSHPRDNPTVSSLEARIGELVEIINASPPPGARTNVIKTELLAAAFRVMTEVACTLIGKF